jgi:hypothetical protein
MAGWRRLGFGCVLVVSLGAASPGHAQSAKPTEDAIVAARAFVVAMQMEQQMAAVLPLIFAQMKKVMTAQTPAQGPAIDDAIAHITTKLQGRTAEVVDEIVQLYAQQITVEDLLSMTAFFRSPAGQRFVTLQPELTRQQMEIGQRWGERVALDAQRELQIYMRQRGFKQ